MLKREHLPQRAGESFESRKGVLEELLVLVPRDGESYRANQHKEPVEEGLQGEY
jgi:hypothetical protein